MSRGVFSSLPNKKMRPYLYASKNIRFMATKNLVSASVTDEAMTAVKKGLADIAAALPFLIALSTAERKRTRIMGQKSVEFVNLALNGAESFSEYLLSSFNKAEFAKDIELINKLWKIRVDVASLLEKVDDTIYGASADAMAAADEVYNYLKSASEKNAAVKALVSEMSKRYERPSKKSKDDGKKPEDGKKPDDKKPGGGDDIQLPSEPPKKPDGVA